MWHFWAPILLGSHTYTLQKIFAKLNGTYFFIKTRYIVFSRKQHHLESFIGTRTMIQTLIRKKK